MVSFSRSAIQRSAFSVQETACELVRARLKKVEQAQREQVEEQQEIRLALRYPKRSGWGGGLLTKDEQEFYERYPQFAEEDLYDFDDADHALDVAQQREKELIQKVVNLALVKLELERVGTMLGCSGVEKVEDDQHLYAQSFIENPYVAAREWKKRTDDPYKPTSRPGVYERTPVKL